MYLRSPNAHLVIVLVEASVGVDDPDVHTPRMTEMVEAAKLLVDEPACAFDRDELVVGVDHPHEVADDTVLRWVRRQSVHADRDVMSPRHRCPPPARPANGRS